MSEVKGQLLGVVLVLSLFAIVSGVITTIVNKLTAQAKDAAKEVGITVESAKNAPELLHY